jgi:hypothetical protein
MNAPISVFMGHSAYSFNCSRLEVEGKTDVMRISAKKKKPKRCCTDLTSFSLLLICPSMQQMSAAASAEAKAPAASAAAAAAADDDKDRIPIGLSGLGKTSVESYKRDKAKHSFCPIDGSHILVRSGSFLRYVPVLRLSLSSSPCALRPSD